MKKVSGWETMMVRHNFRFRKKKEMRKNIPHQEKWADAKSMYTVETTIFDRYCCR